MKANSYLLALLKTSQLLVGQAVSLRAGCHPAEATKSPARNRTEIGVIGGQICLLAICFCELAPSQLTPHPIQFGDVVQQGIQCNYETRLDPPLPTLAGGLSGGTVVDSNGIHRYLAYKWKPRNFFGYDLQVERQPEPDTYRVTFRPLTITPEKVDLDDPSSWTVVPLAGYPEPQIVHASETIALDLFTNPNTGQKITDYLTFQDRRQTAKAYLIQPGDILRINVFHQPRLGGFAGVRPDGTISLRFGGQMQAAGRTTKEVSVEIQARLAQRFQTPYQVNVQVMRIYKPGEPRDFSAELHIASPRVTHNNQTLTSTDSVSAATVWFYLPGLGRYFLSLAPHPNFIRAGEVKGNTLSFTLQGDTITLVSDSQIAPGSARYNLYVSHDRNWLPKNDADKSKLLLGAGNPRKFAWGGQSWPQPAF